MIEMKYYWVEGNPTLKDIQDAFKVVEIQNVLVKLNWSMHGYGYSVKISPTAVQELTPEEFYETHIPKCYGM